MSERIQNVQPKEWNGIKYRSTLEADTAKTLTTLGIPFEYEPRKIILQEGFRSPYQKDKVRALTYTPDFIIGPVMLECKGFETPEWKIKKKLLFKYLMENEPNTIFYQIHDARKSLLEALDHHWTYLGYYIEVLPKPTRKHLPVSCNSITAPAKFDSIQQAMQELGLQGKPIGSTLKSLTGSNQWVYGYNWKLKRIKL
jgi:hypothetical protein